MIEARQAARLALALGGAATLVACSSAPEQIDRAEPQSSGAVQAISGSLDEWRDALCIDTDEVSENNTRRTISSSTCVPADGDGAINFDHFESESSMDMVQSWAGPHHAAETIIDDRPLVIWTPTGEISDLEPLKQFGFTVTPAGFVHQGSGSVPEARNPSLPDPPEAVVALQANQYGYVVVQTASERTQCMVETTFVGCQTSAKEWPTRPGSRERYHGVKINADGTAQWVDGNLGVDTPVTLENQTYEALGWTITESDSATRFVNKTTGHGAIVSEKQVKRF